MFLLRFTFFVVDRHLYMVNKDEYDKKIKRRISTYALNDFIHKWTKENYFSFVLENLKDLNYCSL